MTMKAIPIVHDSVTTDQRALASGVQVLRRENSVATANASISRRVAAYCRVSTDMEQQASSLETQMTVFNDMIAAHAGWELVNIYVDDGITGTSVKNRTQFKQMIADCEAGKIDFILTKSISRFARNTQDCLNYTRKLKDLGVFVYFDDIHLDTSSSSSEMMITILAAVAQEESRSISENMKIGMRMRFKAGKPKWVNTYGFTKGEDGKYHIDEEQAKGVKRIFELYVSGYSLPRIVTQLEKEGIPAMNGGKWWPKSLSTVLHNEKYIGDVMMQKCYTVDHLSHKKVKNDQTVVPSYYVKNHHEGIVDRLTFDRVQTIFQLKDRHDGCVQYPYYGKLFCPLCGEKMVAFHLPGFGYVSAWTCGGHKGEVATPTSCPPYVVHTKYIDRAVLEAYRRLNKGELQTLVAKRGNGAATVNAAQAALRWKTQQPYINKVEYLFLDELVDRITFAKWNECVIMWKFGLVTRIPVQYDKVSDIPDAHPVCSEEGVMLDGKPVWAGKHVMRRLETVRMSCTKIRESSERPRSLRTMNP